MRFLFYGKDGGYESTVWGYWLVEIKSLFSIVLLRFEQGSREAYHNHAFNCFSWVLKGELVEMHLDGPVEFHAASYRPFITRRSTFHKVVPNRRTWVLSFRGPWADSWKEYIPSEDRIVTLTDGRKEQ